MKKTPHTERRKTAGWSKATISVIFVGWSLLLFCSPAWAQDEMNLKSEGIGDAETTVRIIVVSSVLEAGEVYPIEQSIVAQLTDMPVEIQFYRIQRFPTDDKNLDVLATNLMSEHNAKAVFIVQPLSHRSMRLVINDGRQVVSSRRWVDVAGGMPLHEAFAVIVRSATESLIEQENQRYAQEKAARNPSHNASTTKKTTKSVSEVDGVRRDVKMVNRRRRTAGKLPGVMVLDVGGQLSFYSTKTVPSPGFALGLRWQIFRGLHLRLGTTLFSRIIDRTRGTELTLRRYPFYLGMGYSRTLGRFALGGGAEFRLDYVTEHVTTENEDVDVERDGAEFHSGIVVFLCSAFQLSDLISVFGDMGIAVPLHSNIYGIDTAEGNAVIVEPRNVQPEIVVGLRFHFF
ncbi:MAG: hypothetical protein JXR76_04925 [Deltaproteobacteria bacterium]|nr:hypothetical protein [Deltaproteobacteria bacterium]